MPSFQFGKNQTNQIFAVSSLMVSSRRFHAHVEKQEKYLIFHCSGRMKMKIPYFIFGKSIINRRKLPQKQSKQIAMICRSRGGKYIIKTAMQPSNYQKQQHQCSGVTGARRLASRPIHYRYNYSLLYNYPTTIDSKSMLFVIGRILLDTK